MALTQQQFDALVARLTREAQTRPFWYKTRVFLLAMLGYAYVFGILLVLIAIIAGVVYIVSTGRGLRLLSDLALPLALFAWFVSKSLWVKLDPPEGRELRKDEAPRLFAAIDDVTRTLRAPRADVVLVNDEYNASVSQIPRLGVFGWHRNFLTIGLPLMQAMPPDEWRGVLAHEFSHLSRAHARFANWIYRVRKTWYQLMERLENERKGGGMWMFKRFFQWYAPYFAAYTFVLARRDEYEADKLAATVVGPDAMARGFIIGGVRSRLLSRKFWPELDQQVLTTPTPPHDVHSRMADVLRAELNPEPVRSWIEEDLSVETGSVDTHPAHRDRIAALGVDVRDLIGNSGATGAPLGVTAADHFLGPLANELTVAFDVEWQRNAASWWRDRHQRERGAEDELAQLEQRRETLDDAELWQLAHLTDTRRGADAAEPYLRELLRRIPRHAAAAYTLGYNLLDRDDAEGVGLIEMAIERDANATAPGSRVIASYLHRQGKIEEAERYEARAALAEAAQAEAEHERESVYRKDAFLPHALEPAELSTLTAELAKHPRVKRAWLVRKDLKHNPDSPVFVLGIDKGFDWRAYLRAKGIDVDKAGPDPLVDELASTLPFPGEAFIVPLHAENAWLKTALRKVPGARVL
ncbi:MAG TPA: M48 family metallopeptidase [Gemmatimonadaceae bacterium]|nr:M48 family metallopeptidase [Gemmatimonadaceae bacterium]